MRLHATICSSENAYALKSTHVIALPFIYGVECIVFSHQKGRNNCLDHCFRNSQGWRVMLLHSGSLLSSLMWLLMREELPRSHVLIASFDDIIFPTVHAMGEHFWAGWPWPLTYDLWPMTFDLLTWPRYLHSWPPCQNSGLYVCLLGWDSQTDGRTCDAIQYCRQCEKYCSDTITEAIQLCVWLYICCSSSPC